MRVLTPRDQRTLARGIIVIGALLLVFRGIPGLRQWRSAAFSREERARLELLRLTKFTSSARLRDTTRLLALRSKSTDSTRATASASELAALVNQYAIDSGLLVSSLEPMADTSAANVLGVVRVKLEGQADIAGLVSLLAFAEGEEDWAVRVRQMTISAQAPQADDKIAERLQIRLDIEAFRQWSRGERDVSHP